MAKPAYDDLVKLLRDAPPRAALDDPRYWTWHKRVEQALKEVR